MHSWSGASTWRRSPARRALGLTLLHPGPGLFGTELLIRRQRPPEATVPRDLESEFERQPRLVSWPGNRDSRNENEEVEDAWPTERCASRLSARTARSPNPIGRSSNSGGGRV